MKIDFFSQLPEILMRKTIKNEGSFLNFEVIFYEMWLVEKFLVKTGDLASVSSTCMVEGESKLPPVVL